MSMLNCPECGKEISDSAKSCPNCGYSTTKKVKMKKLTKPKKIGFDAIANSVIGCLFVVFLYAECFYEYYLIRLSDSFNGYKLGDFSSLLSFGTDFSSRVIIGIMIVIIVMIVFFGWFKCIKESLQNNSGYNSINIILSIILGVVFFVVTFLAKEGFYMVNQFHGRTFTSFGIGFYIELVLLGLLLIVSIFNYVRVSMNIKKKNNEFSFQAEQRSIVEQPDTSENSM